VTGAGLCAGCRNARVVENRRGSRFWMCELSRAEPRFPKYPILPVVACPGFEPRQGSFIERREINEETE
jgi:hypothetical protein